MVGLAHTQHFACMLILSRLFADFHRILQYFSYFRISNFNSIIFMQKSKFYFSQLIFFIFEQLFKWTQLKLSFSCFHLNLFLIAFLWTFLDIFIFLWTLLTNCIMTCHTSSNDYTLSLTFLSLQKFSLIPILKWKIRWTGAQFWRGSSVPNSSVSVCVTWNRIKKKCNTVSYFFLQLAIAICLHLTL